MKIELATNTKESALTFTDLEKFSDHSGYSAYIAIKSSEFTGRVLCSFSENEMNEFIKQLELCNSTLSGTAKLKSEYYYWYIKFDVSSTGALSVEGLLYTLDHQLEFIFTTDQTCLDPFISDLKKWRSLAATE